MKHKLHAVGTRIEDILRSEATSWTIIGLTLVILVFLAFKVPVPGVSMGVLTVVTAALVFLQPTPLQKLLYIVVIIGLFLSEISAIRADAVSRDTQHKADQDKLQQQFAGVLADNQNRFAGSLKDNRDRTASVLEDNRKRTEVILSNANTNFQDTFRSLNILRELSSTTELSAQEAVRKLAGGNSFPWAQPFSEARFKEGLFPEKPGSALTYVFIIRNSGDYPLSGVDLDVVHMSKDPEQLTNVQVGAIGPRGSRQPAFTFWPDTAKGRDIYMLEFHYAGGVVRQMIAFANGSETSSMRFDETTQIDLAPAPCVLDQLSISDSSRPNYTLQFKNDPTGGSIVDSATGLSLNSAREQRRISDVQSKCAAAGRSPDP